MKKTLTSLTLFILFGFVFNNVALSWDNEVTHRDLSEAAAENSVLGKNNYLKNLGLVEGLKEEFKWGETKRTVRKWLQEGADLEDQPGFLGIGYLNGKARSFNHFHDPWRNIGLDDKVNFPLPLHVTGKSSLLWAQDGLYQENFYEGNWSWQKVREHYFTALTGKDFSGSGVAPTKEKRDEYFARTFRGLGHQMHLIQDTGQPDHVRNDAHPEDSAGKMMYAKTLHIEKWASENRDKINAIAASPFLPAVTFYSSRGLVPIDQLIDTDQYDGSNPGVSLSLGIAEYTNANFFSDDTIFAADEPLANPKHYFPYPKKSSTNIQDFIDQNLLPDVIVSEDGVEEPTFYIAKTKDGEDIDHFLKPIYWANEIDRYTKLEGTNLLLYRRFYRDEKCHEDYASLLIPRAVGYSAGLLNYFFRGEMDMVPDDATGSGYVIVNNTNEDMSGTFELWYDNDKDERTSVKSWTLSINKKSSGNNKSTNITFTPPTDAKEPDKYMLVFRGKLGNEEDAVVGKAISLIPLLIFLHNGQNTLFMTFDKDLKLTPYPPFTLTFGNPDLSAITSPATIQSNKDYNEHYYMPSLTQNTSGADFKGYGKANKGYFLLGNRNSFTPTEWDKNSPLQYNRDKGYLSYPGTYICSGRRNWAYSGDSVIKDIEVWDADVQKYYIKYKTKDGEVRGADLKYREIYAIMSPTAVIGIKMEWKDTGWIEYKDPEISTTVGLDQKKFRFGHCGPDPELYSPYGYRKRETGSYFSIGNSELDLSDYYYFAEHYSTVTIEKCSLPPGTYPPDIIPVYPQYVTTWTAEQKWQATFRVLDFDNIGDETFIVIYTIRGEKALSYGTSYFPNEEEWGPPYPRSTGYGWSGDVKSYIIAYKLKGSNIQKNEVCWTGFLYYPSPGGFQGQAMFNPSTKIFDFNGKTYIAYSYSIYDYIGNQTVVTFDSEESSFWRFNKRIVGLIDADTGQKSETEITDSFLGNMYDNFDKTLYSAIGFHNGSGK